MNVYQKIVEVRKIANGFNKDKKSSGGNSYEYVSGNQILAKIKDKMNELGLILQPSIKESQYQIHRYVHVYANGNTKDKIDFLVDLTMNYTWINADSPEDVCVVPWHSFGQQDEISKSMGSALTYGERYFILKYLGLPTDEDDPDAKSQKTPDNDKKPPSQQTTPSTNENDAKGQETPNTGTETKTPTSPAQLSRLYIIAKKKGKKEDIVNAEIKKNYLQDDPLQMKPDQYKKIVAHYESLPDAAK